MASQSGRRVLLTTALALCLTAVAPQLEPRATDLFDEIYRRGAPLEARLESLSASFVETTTSTLLTEPIVARGRVVARRPSDVLLTYDAPDPRVVRILDGRMTLEWPSRQIDETRNVRGNLQRAQRMFMDKSPDELRKLFDITATVADDDPASWKVTFVPRRRQLREGVERLHLWIDQSSLLLHALEMELRGGDRRRMEFSDIVVNPDLGPDAFVADGR